MSQIACRFLADLFFHNRAPLHDQKACIFEFRKYVQDAGTDIESDLEGRSCSSCHNLFDRDQEKLERIDKLMHEFPHFTLKVEIEAV